MKRKISVLLAIVLIISLLLTACSLGKKDKTDKSDAAQTEVVEDSGKTEEEPSDAAAEIVITDDSKPAGDQQAGYSEQSSAPPQGDTPSGSETESGNEEEKPAATGGDITLPKVPLN